MDEVAKVSRRRLLRNFRSVSCPVGLTKWTDTDLLERDLESKEASVSVDCLTQEAFETTEEYLLERLEERERSIGIDSFVQQESESKLDDSNLRVEFSELLSKYRHSIAGNLSRDNILSTMEVERENLLTEISQLQAKLRSLVKTQREGAVRQLLHKKSLAESLERCELLQEWNQKLTREVKLLREDVKDKTTILAEYRAKMSDMQHEFENGEARFQRIRLESIEVSKELEIVEMNLSESKLKEHERSVQIGALMSQLENQAENMNGICSSPKNTEWGSVVLSDISVGQVSEVGQVPNSDGDLPLYTHFVNDGEFLHESLQSCHLRGYSINSEFNSTACWRLGIFHACEETISPTTEFTSAHIEKDVLTEYQDLTAAALIIKFPDVEITKSELIAASKFASYPDVYETMKNVLLQALRREEDTWAQRHEQVEGKDDSFISDGEAENCVSDRYWSLISKPSGFISKLSQDIREKCGPALLPSIARLTPHPLMFSEG